MLNVNVSEANMIQLDKEGFFWKGEMERMGLYNKLGDLLLEIVQIINNGICIMTSDAFEECDRITDIVLLDEELVVYYTTLHGNNEMRVKEYFD